MQLLSVIVRQTDRFISVFSFFFSFLQPSSKALSYSLGQFEKSECVKSQRHES